MSFAGIESPTAIAIDRSSGVEPEGFETHCLSETSSETESFPDVGYQIGWFALGCLLPITGMIPFLCLHGIRLWNQAHLRAVPIAIVASLALLLARCQRGRPSRLRTVVITCVIVAGVLLSIVGAYRLSPWLVATSAILVWTGWGLGAFGQTHWGRVIGVCSLSWFAVPLPMGYDPWLNQKLESLSAWMCNGLLDAFAIPNVRESVVITTVGQRIPFDDWFLGLDGLYSLLAVTVFLAILSRRSLAVSLASLIMVPLWMTIGMSIRGWVMVLWFQNPGDANAGMANLLIACLMFGSEVVMIWLSMLSIAAMLAPIENETHSSPATNLFNRIVQFPPSGPTRAYARLWYPQAIFGLLGTVGLIGLGVGIVAAVEVYRHISMFLPPPHIAVALADRFPGESSLPATIGRFQKVSFENVVLSPLDVRGRHAHHWRYTDGENTLSLSLEFPFRDWVPMNEFPVQTYWKLDQREQTLVELSNGGQGTVGELMFNAPGGAQARVWYGYFGATGCLTLGDQTSASLGTTAKNLIALRNQLPSDLPPISCRVRMLLETVRSPSQETLSVVERAFLQILQELESESRSPMLDVQRGNWK